MKLYEVLQTNEVDLTEGILTKALAAAGFVLSSMVPSQLDVSDQVPSQPIAQSAKPSQVDRLVNVASNKYKVSPDVIKTVVQSAVKHQYKDFPTAKDILAVVGVESSFNPNAVSQLKKDPAKGLLQVRPGVWKLPASSLATIDAQIKTGSDILRDYYVKLGDREAALHAYNVGLTNHKKGKGSNPRYVPKINKERDMYTEM